MSDNLRTEQLLSLKRPHIDGSTHWRICLEYYPRRSASRNLTAVLFSRWPQLCSTLNNEKRSTRMGESRHAPSICLANHLIDSSCLLWTDSYLVLPGFFKQEDVDAMLNRAKQLIDEVDLGTHPMVSSTGNSAHWQSHSRPSRTDGIYHCRTRSPCW